MLSSSEVISLIKGFSLSERLLIVEEILRNIREENIKNKELPKMNIKNEISPILSFVGILDNKEADLMESAIDESRKIDTN
jgi:hypothetical protein